jgi:predicted GNAT family acetyltransferase
VTTHTVRHDVDGGRFVAEVEGAEAYLRYRLIGEDAVEFRSTFVPPALRGQGLAREIVRAGLAWAQAEGRTAIPRCSYVRQLIEQDPTLEPLTAD